MGTKYTDDFFRDVYNSELDHKHKLETTDSFMAVLLMALSAVAYYYLRAWPCCGLCVYSCISIAIYSLLFATMCLAIYLINNAVIHKVCLIGLGILLTVITFLLYINYDCLSSYLFVAFSTLYFVVFFLAVTSGLGSFLPRYKAYISSPEECDQFVKGLEDYFYKVAEQEEIGEKVEGDLREMLRQQFVAAGQINRRLSIRKSYWQSRARGFIIVAVFIMLLNAIPTCLVEHNANATTALSVNTPN